MSGHLARTLLAAALIAVAPAAASGEEQGSGPSVEEEARAGVERLLRALELFLQQLPQFGAPYIDEDGDIVIPRKRQPAEPAPAPEGEETPPAEEGVTETAI